MSEATYTVTNDSLAGLMLLDTVVAPGASTTITATQFKRVKAILERLEAAGRITVELNALVDDIDEVLVAGETYITNQVETENQVIVDFKNTGVGRICVKIEHGKNCFPAVQVFAQIGDGIFQLLMADGDDSSEVYPLTANRNYDVVYLNDDTVQVYTDLALGRIVLTIA